MSQENWTLRLVLTGPHGENYVIAVGISADIMREITKPYDLLRDFNPNVAPFEAAVEVLRRREFRKDLFIQETTRIGTLLAERMEDKEGWHGPDRAERLKDWGKLGTESG